MLKALDKIDKRASVFLFFFLHIIFVSALIFLARGIYIVHLGDAYTAAVFGFNVEINVEYLLLSLCEAVGGALFLDYVFRSGENISR